LYGSQSNYAREVVTRRDQGQIYGLKATKNQLFIMF
jgi:hypothetical protein